MLERYVLFFFCGAAVPFAVEVENVLFVSLLLLRFIGLENFHTCVFLDPPLTSY